MSSAAFDTATWLGVEILGVTGKPIHLGARVLAAFKAIAEDGTFTEDDVPVDGTKLSDVQLKTLAIVLKASLTDGAKMTKPAATTLGDVDYALSRDATEDT